MPVAKDTGYPVKSLQSLTRTYINSTPVPAGSLIEWNGNLCTTAGQPIMGISMDDAVINQTISVGMAGLHEGISGGAIAIGNLIGADASGRCVAVGAGTQSIGRAMTATTAANQKFQIYITREGTN